MTVTRLAAVGVWGRGAGGGAGEGSAPALANLAHSGPAPMPAAAPPATEYGRRWRMWPGSTCRWGSQTWGG